MHSLFIGNIDLEADDIAVLNLTLGERALGFHQLDHTRFDFLNADFRLIELRNIQ